MQKLIAISLIGICISAPALAASRHGHGGGPAFRAPAFRAPAMNRNFNHGAGVRHNQFAYGNHGYRPNNFRPYHSGYRPYHPGYRPYYPGYRPYYSGYGYGNAVYNQQNNVAPSYNQTTVNENGVNFAPSVNVLPYNNQYNPYMIDQQPAVPIEPVPEILPEETELPPPSLPQDPAEIKRQRIINTINRLILELKGY